MRKSVKATFEFRQPGKATPRIDFMGIRRITAAVSLLVVLSSLFSLLFNGLQLGLDFSSGIAVQLGYSQAVSPGTVSNILQMNGIEDTQVVNFGSDREIRIVLKVAQESDANQAAAAVAMGARIAALLTAASGQPVELLGSDFVSAKAGRELAEKGGMGLLVSLLIITVYISLRFQFKFAVGAVVALAHDVIITVGCFSLFGMPFDLQVLAGLLAVIGYSLNDTIIVADRIRENFRRLRQGTPVELINLSINQTLSRTLVTSGTTLMVVLTMLFIGGEAARGFAISLTIGIVVGTYSSIFIASSALLYLGVSREDLMVPVREGADPESRPSIKAYQIETTVT